MRIISKKEAEKIIADIGPCVIKKSVGTNSGKDVEIYRDGVNDPEKTIEDFGKDFVIQEIVHQCDELARINASSINTFRVITYICNDEICLCPTVLRMGRSGRDKDNMHYGGICVGVNFDGTLKRTAFAEYGESFESHPDSGTIFCGYTIPVAGEQLWTIAKELHSKVPCMGVISWDLSIDPFGIVTVIEMNTTGQSTWFNQMVNGESLFGENTGIMLELIKKK